MTIWEGIWACLNDDMRAKSSIIDFSKNLANQDRHAEQEPKESETSIKSHTVALLHTPVTLGKTNIQGHMRSHVDSSLIKEQINPKTKTLGLQFYRGRLGAEIELVEKIKLVLPNWRALWLLVYRFFTVLYTFIPYLDEDLCKKEVTRLLGDFKSSSRNIDRIKVKSRNDFANLGILLLMIRLSHLSLFSNLQVNNEENMNLDSGSLNA